MTVKATKQSSPLSQVQTRSPAPHMYLFHFSRVSPPLPPQFLFQPFLLNSAFLGHPHQWMQKFCKFAHLKPTFSILHIHLSKTLISVYLLYTLFSLNNHFIFFFLLFQQPYQSNPFSHFSFLNTILSLSLSLPLSLMVNFLSFSSFSHLSSPVNISSFAHFFTRNPLTNQKTP